MTVRFIIFRIHWLLGVTIGFVLAVMALTGATMAFEDQITSALSMGVVTVEPRQAQPLTPDQVLARFKVQRPDAQPVSIILQSKPGASPQVTFVTETNASTQNLYLDPYDGRILGHVTGERFFATVRKMHRFLLLPADGRGWGRQITGVAAFSLIFFVMSGLYLRWPKRPPGWRYWLKPCLRAGRRWLYRSLHAAMGTWLAVIYLIVAMTGLTFSYGWYKMGFTRALGGHVVADDRPGKQINPRSGGAEHAQVPRVDAAWRTMLRQGHSWHTIVISVPKTPASPVRIRDLAADAPNECAYDDVTLDGSTGAVLKRRNYADMAFGDRIVAARLAVHRGSYFGLLGTVVFMLAALTMPLFPVTGWLLYLGRRRGER